MSGFKFRKGTSQKRQTDEYIHTKTLKYKAINYYGSVGKNYAAGNYTST